VQKLWITFPPTFEQGSEMTVGFLVGMLSVTTWRDSESDTIPKSAFVLVRT